MKEYLLSKNWYTFNAKLESVYAPEKHIDKNTAQDYQEHVKTLLHELVHCCQDIRGVTNNEDRESEAYMLEEEYFNEFNLLKIKKRMYALN